MKNRLEHSDSTSRQDSQEATVHGQQAMQQAAHRDLSSVEDALRTDRAQTPVPERVAERLADSIARESTRPGPWWRRIFR